MLPVIKLHQLFVHKHATHLLLQQRQIGKELYPTPRVRGHDSHGRQRTRFRSWLETANQTYPEPPATIEACSRLIDVSAQGHVRRVPHGDIHEHVVLTEDAFVVRATYNQSKSRVTFVLVALSAVGRNITLHLDRIAVF